MNLRGRRNAVPSEVKIKHMKKYDVKEAVRDSLKVIKTYEKKGIWSFGSAIDFINTRNFVIGMGDGHLLSEFAREFEITMKDGKGRVREVIR